MTRSAGAGPAGEGVAQEVGRYLLSTAETAWALVMASAATVAARSSRCTSSALISRSEEKATSRPWSSEPATMRTTTRDGGRAAGRTEPTGSASTMNRPDPSKQPRSSTCSRPPALASTRPSGVVTMATPPQMPTSSSHRRSSPPPVSTIWTSAWWASSERASTAACRLSTSVSTWLMTSSKLDGVGQPDDRQPEPVGLLEHRRGQLGAGSGRA